ncbi:alpha-(1,6)-fucosyltransferase-like [Oppia nitens]|uniref:alpha-(1,6)-fucosyltransferase-like n=1 Tax=Oppia nitens TaxID=1686743 RepID=UPI0023DA3AF2|nr:alpha-(1,6)-fucosyltransferase-like [Oppia nitens]
MIHSFSVTSASRLLIAIVIVWLLVIFVITGPLIGWSHNRDDGNVDMNSNGEMILARLSRAMNELTALKAQNEELRSLLQNYLPIDLSVTSGQQSDAKSSSLKSSYFPSQEYELSRRRVEFNMNELWHFLRTKTNSSIMQFVNQIKHNMFYDLEVIEKRDNIWRKSEFKRLNDLVKNKINELQNPVKDKCGSTKKLICQLNKGCGFGCQIHHLVYCMIVAMATKRTLIMNSQNWRYAQSKSKGSSNKGWDSVFLPLSQTCLDDSGSSRISWSSSSDLDIYQVVDLPIIDSMRSRPDYLPLSIPEELTQSLVQLHGAPIVWFIGQIVSFLMRPSQEMSDYIKKQKERFNFRGPIVGVHVRRTDKIGTEAAFHPLAEYMKFVADYYDRLDLFYERNQTNTKVERLVYLATDDSSLWSKEIKPFEDMGYIFIGDSQISQTASLGRRYSIDSLRNIILDIWLLSETEFLVCTFSSQVCRLAYELMQTRIEPKSYSTKLDKSSAYYSLDDIYYFGGQSDHNQIAILNHKSQNSHEIDLKIGDVVGIAGNHWNGYSKGLNRETKQNGLYPGFKTNEKIASAHFKLFESN